MTTIALSQSFIEHSSNYIANYKIISDWMNLFKRLNLI